MSTYYTFFAPKISSDSPDSATRSKAVIQCLLKGVRSFLGHGVEFDEPTLKALEQQVGGAQSLPELASSASALGFEVEQLWLSHELLLSDFSVLPIIVASGASVDRAPLDRVLVIWNKIGPFFQVVDSQGGRRWLRHADLLAELAAETVALSPEQSLEAVESEPFKTRLHARLQHLGADTIPRELFRDYVSLAGWSNLACIDAAVRMVAGMVQDRVVPRGKSALQVLRVLVSAAVGEPSVIPEEYWSIKAAPLPERQAQGTAAKAPANRFQLRAVAALRIHRWEEDKFKKTVAATAHKASAEGRSKSPTVFDAAFDWRRAYSDNSLFAFAKFLLADGTLPLTLWINTIILAAMGIFFQVILFRGMMSLVTNLTSLSQRLWLLGLISAFMITIITLQWFTEQINLSLGQRLNSRLRLTLLSMLPNLSSHYFRETSPAEMIDRIHSGRTSELLPSFVQIMILNSTQLFFVLLGIAWIDWLSGILALLMVLAFVLGMVARMQLQGQQREVLEQRSRLSQFYRDGMCGLVAVRTHSAERAARREYESRLSRWGKKKLALQVSEMWYSVYDVAVTYSLVSLIIVIYAARTSDPSHLLLLAYWSVNLVQVARNQLAVIVLELISFLTNLQSYTDLLEMEGERDLMPVTANSSTATNSEGLRLMDVDRAGRYASKKPKGRRNKALNKMPAHRKRRHFTTKPPKVRRLIDVYISRFMRNRHLHVTNGMAIGIQDVSVRVGELMLLKNISLDIAAGHHLAVVGTSGAGKSTLVGLLLGWHYPDSGQLLIDNQPLSYEGLLKLRQETAWVDPTIQLWNRSLLYNLYYAAQQVPLNIVVEEADLRGMLERLEDGLQTTLGSEGKSLSGGEGQRVRLGRGLQRQNARLVLLDEAFRGLSRSKRQSLLRRARKFWSNSTLICITHDVSQTLDFERVLVIDKGELVEDGHPLTLAKDGTSRYAALLAAEENVHEKLWSKDNWRRLWLEGGQLSDRTEQERTN
jgi:ABC-type multidrug transport system fused ATPase/permease subunit